MKKKILSVICIATMAFALTACASSGNKAASSTAAASSAASSAVASSVASSAVASSTTASSEVGGMAGMANPMEEMSLKDIAGELNLKAIDISDATDSYKINGGNPIYQFNTKINGVEYRVRLQIIDKENGAEDISGIYFDSKSEHKSYESADKSKEPTINIEKASEYAAASALWNGYNCCVSCEVSIEFDDFYKVVKDIAIKLISKDNIK